MMNPALITARIKIMQQGSTLLVALIMLVLLTLLAISAMQSTTSSIQVVGNAQFHEEARAAAQTAVERVMSDGNFRTTPPAPQNIDVNQDGTFDYTVTFFNPADVANTAPKCLSATPVTQNDLNVPPDCGSSIDPICFWTSWDITATVSDVRTGASVVMHQGVRTIAGFNAVAAAGC